MPSVFITAANRYGYAVASTQSVSDAVWLQLSRDGAAVLSDSAQLPSVLPPWLAALVAGAGTLTAAQTAVLAAQITRAGSGRSILMIGDSRTEQAWQVLQDAGTGVVDCPSLLSIGFTSWMTFLGGDLFPQLINSGLSGRRARQLATNDTSTSSRNTLQSAVINPVAQDAFIWLGTNDYLVENATAANVVGYIRTIAAAAKTSGKRVTVMCEVPSTTATAAQAKEILKGNELLYKYAAAGEFLLLDLSADLVDYTSLTSYIGLSTTRYDGLHPNNWGAYLVGKRVAAHYRNLFTTMPSVLSRHFLDDYSNDAANVNQYQNSLFNGTTGWTIAGVSGIVSAITSTVIASPFGAGNALALDVTTNAAGGVNLAYRTAGYNNSPAWAAGDTMHAEALIAVQGNGGTGNPSNVHAPYMRLDIASAVNARSWWMSPTQTATASPINEPFQGTARTLPYFWNGAESSRNNYLFLGAQFTAAGSARFIFSAPRVIKNDAYYANSASGGWWV